MKQETKNKLKKLEIFTAVTLVLVSTLFLFNNTGITGHFSADFRSQRINLLVEQSQIYSIKANSIEEVYVSSLRMSGNIMGGGSVEIYLEDKGQKFLIYKNVREKEQGMPAITGFAVAAEPEEEQEITLMLDKKSDIEWKNELSLDIDEEFVSGPFHNKCSDTCFIEMLLSSGTSYNLVFMVEPGTKLELNKITYTLKDSHI